MARNCTDINNSVNTTKKRRKNHKKKTKRKVGTKANTNQSHLSILLFGGPGQFVTRTDEIKTVQFRNAFSEGLSYDYLQRGAEKNRVYPQYKMFIEKFKTTP